MAGISRVVLRGCGLPIPAGSNRGHETAADAALACSKPRRGPTPAWTACPCGTEQRALVLHTILCPGRSLRRSRMMRTQHAGLRRRRLRLADPCGVESLAPVVGSESVDRPQPGGGGIGRDVRCSPPPREAAAGCRPLRGRNRSVCPSARQQQCSECGTQLAKRTQHAGLRRRKLRPADPCGIESDATDRRDARQSPARRSLPKSGRPLAYLIRSLSLRSW